MSSAVSKKDMYDFLIDIVPRDDAARSARGRVSLVGAIRAATGNATGELASESLETHPNSEIWTGRGR